MHTQLILTEDGSHTLLVPEIDESYHSTHGAIQESRHIFINAGLKQCATPEIRVLEIGFGTGLNAFLTLLEAEKRKIKIHYTSLEHYPLDVEKALQLNYAEQLNANKKADFELLHTCEWNKETAISEYFYIEKIKVDFTQYTCSEMFDICFFDAFSPEKQPEMWTEERFKMLFSYANKNAILTTYCAKGSVRRAMLAAGFKVERLQGPPGKREMLRARVSG